jgi:2-hydroxychromene-2-carboxylate isomerase
MKSTKTVRFYYSVGSRYSYLAATQMEPLGRETGCEIVWCPLYSVDLYRLRGANPFEGEAISGQYDWDYRQYDAECWAEYYGIPYREPRGRVDFDPRLLARACVAAGRVGAMGAVRTYSKSIFSAMFVEDLTVIDRAECVKRAEDIGLPRKRFSRELDSPEVERELEESALQARSEGAFGVPTFVAGGKLFFGNDRLPLLRHHLHGKEGDAGLQSHEMR